MKEVLLWVFVYIPLAFSILSFIVPIILMGVFFLGNWISGFLSKNSTSISSQPYTDNAEAYKAPAYQKDNKSARLQPRYYFLIFVGVLSIICIANITTMPKDKTNSQTYKTNTNYAKTNKETQNKKLINRASQYANFYVDVAKITSEVELKRSMKDVYDACVKVNLAQPDNGEIDAYLFCECFVSTFFYNLNSYGVSYIFEHFSSMSQIEVNNIMNFHKGKKVLMFDNFMSEYKTHLELNQVLETQRDVAAFSCVRQLADKKNFDFLPDTDILAESLEDVNLYDENLNKETNESLGNDKNLEKILQRNMVFMYNICLKMQPLHSAKEFSGEMRTMLCKCFTRDYFYFVPGIYLYDWYGSMKEMSRFSETELAKEIANMSNFKQFEDITVKSSKMINVSPFLKKQELVQVTAMGGCMRDFLHDYLLDTDSVADELFDRNKQ